MSVFRLTVYESSERDTFAPAARPAVCLFSPERECDAILPHLSVQLLENIASVHIE